MLLIPLRDSLAIDVQVEYARTRQLLMRGFLEKSQAEATRDYDRFVASSPQWAFRFRLLEAEAMVSQGRYEEAIHLFDVLSPALDNPEEKIEGLSFESLALAHLERYSEASSTLSEAESICASKTFEACGQVPRTRGVFAIEKGDFFAAQKLFHDSLDFARAHHDRWLEVSALSNLGAVSLQEERYDEAADWSRAAYREATELGAEDLAQRSLGNLGWAFFGLGDAERSLDFFLEAEKRAASLGDLHVQLNWLITAGDVYREQSDFVRASESFRKALNLGRQIDNKEDIVNVLEDLGHAAIDAGKLEEANSYLHQLSPLLSASSNRLDALDVTFAQARIAAASHHNNDAEDLFRAVEKDPASQASMRLGAEHELARLYESESDIVAADRMYRTSLTTFESARDQLKNEESKLPFLANATGIYDDYIHFLVTQGKTDEALALADRSRARTLEQGLGLITNSRSDANTSLHPGEIARKTNATLLFYWIGERESYLWAITPAKTTMFSLPARSQIAPIADRYRKTLLGLSDPVEASNADGMALYRTLVEPARNLFQPGSNVVILSDGALSQLNFETLIADAPTPHYFIEDATLVSAPSLHLLASAKPPERSGNSLLLVGDAVSPNSDYPELPKAASEMRQIEQHFPTETAMVFAREQATAGSYISSAPQRFAYIHFVAHGVASRTDPLDSAIILSRSTAEEDSFKLHARDIMQHPIHARLVTISACYGSGTRSYVGEGLVGLAWAFLRAGAHNVIGALWEVSDESTPRLMGMLYQGLHDGMPPATALRQAKLSLLHAKGEFRKPFFWAPLQVYTGL